MVLIGWIYRLAIAVMVQLGVEVFRNCTIWFKEHSVVGISDFSLKLKQLNRWDFSRLVSLFFVTFGTADIEL